MVDYKNFIGNYDAFAEAVIREDEELGDLLRIIQRLFSGCRKYVVKQKSAISNLIICFLSANPQNPLTADEVAGLRSAWGDDQFEAKLMGICAHALLIGKPGRAKTVLCLVLAALVEASFARVQCTMDIEPHDIRGSAILLPDGTSKYLSGPIEHNIVLFDELNRTSPKSQSAVLEAMAEGHLTRNLNIDATGENIKRTIMLPRPFWVIGTANPQEQEGTYRLTQAQEDRFAVQIPMSGIGIESMMKVIKINDEEYIRSNIEPVMTIADALRIRQFIHEKIRMDPAATRYTSRLARALLPYDDLPKEETESDAEFSGALRVIRETPLIIANASFLLQDLIDDAMYERMAIVGSSCARAQSFLRGRRNVMPEDIKKIFPHVARHRITLSPQAEALLSRRLVTKDGRKLDRIELKERILQHVLAHVPIS